MRRVPLAFAALVFLTGCAQQAPTDQVGTMGAGIGASGGGALASLRPKADPAMIEKMRKEAEAARKQQIEQMNAQAQAQGQPGFGGMASANGQVLPAVGNTSISGVTAPPADQAGNDGPVVTPVEQKAANPGIPFWPFGQPQAPADKPPEIATYGGYGGGAVPPPPPGASAPGGLVPPPPAVSVSGQLNPYGAMPGANPMDPYGANPYMQQQMQQPQPQAPAQRPALFGSGGARSSSSDDQESTPTRKKKDFVPITPTGMEARSPFKQRDDLKVAWKSALAANPALQKLTAKDDKLAADLGKLDVALPTESTKGSVNVSQRQIDAVFKPVAIDKKAAPLVKKLENDLMQSYHRYLYSYNKWALAAQTVAARKQEVEVAGTQAEQQRAAADLSSAQNDADAAKEDMRSAQYDLASVTGPQGAAAIIQRVSGARPSVESLAIATQSDTASAPAQADSGGGGGLLGGILGFGKSALKAGDSGGSKEKADAKKTKDAKGKKGGKQDSTAADLSPAPTPAQALAAKEPADDSPASSSSSSPISFELKNVNVTPRKSTLRVSIRNNGNESFSFDPDVISLSEGNRKISEATVRAEFDATMVQPNQEVTGTITIYGRPWNDRLSVSLTDGGKTIQMRR